MTFPWEQTPTYGTIAEAEAAIIAAGFYVRDPARHVWIDEAGRTAKVMRDDAKQNLQFFVEFG